MGTRSLRERQDQNRRRGQKRIERIGLVGHEGVAGEHAAGKRRDGKRNGEQRGAQGPWLALRRNNRRGRATRRAVIGPRRQDRPLESGEEDRRQRKGREHVDCQLQRQRRCREHRLQRHDDDEVEEIDRVGDAAEVEACASDDAIAEQALGPPEHADRDHAERRRDVRKRKLSRGGALDGHDGDSKLDGNRDAKQREQYAQTRLARGVVQSDRRTALEREIEQKAPDDRVDAKQRDPPDIQVPVMRRNREPQRRNNQNDQDCEHRLEPAVASSEQPCDKKQGRRKKHIEPFLDRETPGDGIEVDMVGGGKKVLDVEEIADKVRGHQVAGQDRNDDQRDDIGRDGAHPAPDEKHAEIAPWLCDHPVDDLGREHEAAEDEKDFDAGDRERFRERLKRRVGGEIMRDGDGERRRSTQEVERGAALHFGAV